MIDAELLQDLLLDNSRLLGGSFNKQHVTKLAVRPSSTTVDKKRGPFKMTFGKFKGTVITEVPTWYLRWCINNLDRLGSLLNVFKRELDNRNESY